MITQLAGNGRVLLAVDEDGEWSDLFYPYPGEFQHLREMRTGLYDPTSGRFAWLRGGDGPMRATPPVGSAGPPVSRWSGLGLQLDISDHVHPNHDLVVRTFRVVSENARTVRLFAYHSLQIAESMFRGTAYVDPERDALVHYKRGFYFEFFSEPAFSDAVCGEHTLKGLRGSYVDAEDGRLDGRRVAHGAADSVLQWDLPLAPHAERIVRLFVALGTDRDSVHRIRRYVGHGGPHRFEREARRYWETWSNRRLPEAPAGLSERVAALYRASVLVLRQVSAPNGAILASPDTRSLVLGGDTYNYCWWRDGGYVAKAMDEAGLYENAHRFFGFARDCQQPDGAFFHRHFPDGERGSTWHPPPFLQVDQTATVVSALWHHFKRGGDPEVLLDFWPMVKSAASFLLDFRDPATGLPAPSFDLWEERSGIHLYSTAAVAHALERAARIAEELGKDGARWHEGARAYRAAAAERFWDAERGRFVRSLRPRDDRLDASLLLALKHGLLAADDPRLAASVDAVEARLAVPRLGGLARFEGDDYCGVENPWIICTLWLAEMRLALGDAARCRELLEWTAAHATPTLLLPEQLDAATGAPLSATPLTWSHSTFVDVVHKFARAAGVPPPAANPS